MKVGLDARSIFMPRPRGTGRNLFDAYRLIPALHPDWEFLLYHQRDAQTCPLAAGPTHSQHPNVRTWRVDMPGDRWDVWFQLRLPLAAWADRLDLLHFPANAAPAWCPVPFVVTIHDLIPLNVEDQALPRERRIFERGVRRAVHGAAHIITVSQATGHQLHDEFGVAWDRMTVIPWAPDSTIAATPAGDVQRVRQHYPLPDRWLLNFSGPSRRKNAEGLIEALARLPGDTRAHVGLVVFVGCEPAELRVQLTTQAESRGVLPLCRFLGFVPHQDLAGLLRGARGLLMPSLAEGFGLPILDAFACGTPVLTSRLSSMPAVAGDAAVYCDPRDPASIAAGIVALLDDARAADLVRQGHARVQQFTWERTAAAMCAVYERGLADVKGSRRAHVLNRTPTRSPESAIGGAR